MSRISKSKATQLAKELIKKNRERLDLKEVELKKICYDLAYSKMNTALTLVLSTSDAKYISMSNSVYFSHNSDTVSFSSSKPLPRESYNGHYCSLNKIEFKQIKLKIDKSEKQREEFRELFNKLEAAIYQLRTPSRITKEFPSLGKLLNAPTVTLPSDLSTLKNQILK